MKRILVVEDNEANMYLCTRILTAHKYDVIPAGDGKEAIETAKKEKPDLILMDIQLPDMDGLQVTRNIRGLEEGKNVPIVALTSYAMAGDKQKALDAGCTGYIEKPINPETFIEEIKKYL